MRVLAAQARSEQPSARCAVLLPGAYDTPQAFLQGGFAAAVQRRQLPLDLYFAALELEHVNDRSMLERLRAEVVLPARARGCRSIWLGGISFGGFLALLYAQRYSQDIDGLCLLAPYLGSRRTAPPIGDEDEALWQFVKTGANDLPVRLGYGAEDRFADRHRLLAAELPRESVNIVHGGHDWPTWLLLWEDFLQQWMP